MKNYYPFFRSFMLMAIVLMIAVTAVAQTDTADNEIVFHIVKKQPLGCKKKPRETDLTREGLRGTVRSVVAECYGTGNFKGVISDGLISTTTTQYDTAGTWTEEVIKYEHTSYKVISKRKFDGKGRILSESISSGDHRGHAAKEYQYDVAGRLRQTRLHGRAATDGPKKNVGIPFDFTSHYDTSGHCIHEEDFDGKKAYTYNTNGDCILYVSRVTGQKNDSIAYVYDGRCRRSISYQTGHHPLKTTYIYDTRDSLIEIDQVIAAGDRKTIYEYNTDGDKITEKTIDNSGRVVESKSFKYLYDVHGNWIQKDIYGDDLQRGYYIRRITYY